MEGEGEKEREEKKEREEGREKEREERRDLSPPSPSLFIPSPPSPSLPLSLFSSLTSLSLARSPALPLSTLRIYTMLNRLLTSTPFGTGLSSTIDSVNLGHWCMC